MVKKTKIVRKEHEKIINELKRERNELQKTLRELQTIQELILNDRMEGREVKEKELKASYEQKIDKLIKNQEKIKKENEHLLKTLKEKEKERERKYRKSLQGLEEEKKELKEEYNPANEEARKIIEKIKENKKNAPKPKELITLSSMISGLGWKANNINIFNVWDLTVYQLYDGLNRLKIIDDYQFTLSGIYAGTIDSGKINLKDINWMKINES